MNTEEVGSKLVALCREQKWLDAINSLYAEDVVSVEAQPIGDNPPDTRGLDKVRAKTLWFLDTKEVHSGTLRGPFVARDQFVVQFEVDVTDKASGQRATLSEAGVYTVKNGNVVREEFFPGVESRG